MSVTCDIPIHRSTYWYSMVEDKAILDIGLCEDFFRVIRARSEEANISFEKT